MNSILAEPLFDGVGCNDLPKTGSEIGSGKGTVSEAAEKIASVTAAAKSRQ
jgi:hypothetical protein